MQKLNENPTNADVAYAGLLRRNDDALQIITALRNVALSNLEKADLVKAGFARLQNNPNAACQQHIQQVTQRNCEMIADLQRSVSNATQKQHASAWFGKFATQFSSLTLAN